MSAAPGSPSSHAWPSRPRQAQSRRIVHRESRPRLFRALPLRCRFSAPDHVGYTFAMSESSAARDLESILEPVTASLNEAAARKLVGLRAGPKLQARVAALARKCNEGELTPAERSEYEGYVLAGELLAILQAKARMLLRPRRRPS